MKENKKFYLFRKQQVFFSNFKSQPKQYFLSLLMIRNSAQTENKQVESSKMELRSTKKKPKISYQDYIQKVVPKGRPPKNKQNTIEIPKSQYNQETILEKLHDELVNYCTNFEIGSLFHAKIQNWGEEQEKSDLNSVFYQLSERNKKLKKECIADFSWLAVQFAVRLTVEHREQFYELMILMSERSMEGVVDQVLQGQNFRCLKLKYMQEARQKENIWFYLKQLVKRMEEILEDFWLHDF